ncbi:DUF4872 domain-containing protein [Siminovitchia sp. FSL H7-0308]|uniref:BtrH N-terminal domain-containing protein n=1 Tax=unclassified Siminovitchia TaxID=2837530 RepID=UPI00097D5686|nr:hypothetical protein BLX87_21915 [Bacillus sp. VT-16-64]
MSTLIDFDTHRLGLNCGSAPIRDMLEFYGYPFSEPMCFGLGSGLHFVYHHGGKEVVDRQYRAPLTVITGRTETPFVELCSVLGIKITFKRTHDREFAWQTVKELVDRHIPVACDIDVSKIHDTNPIAETFGLSMGGHKVILIGYDEDKNTATIIENVIEEPVTIPLDVFQHIRSSAELYPSENEWFYIDPPRQIQHMKKALKMAIIKNVQLMKYPAFSLYGTDVECSGLSGIQLWREEITKWPEILHPERLELSIFTVHIQNSISGGGLFRKMYARFLREADDYLHEENLVRASNMYRKLAKHWDEIIKTMLEAYKKKEYNVFFTEAFSHLADEIVMKEKEAIRLLEEASDKWL